jgi:hypothetical protein
VAVVQLLVVALGLVIVASLPCLLAMICAADDIAGRVGRSIRRRLGGRLRRRRRLWAGQPWRERRRLARLARTVRQTGRQLPREPAGPPIEQVAADLRRLANQRLGVGRRSEIWFAAVQRAYDDRLRVACRELDVEEHLGELDGIDLDIERVRVEGSLQAAGMNLRLSGATGRPEPR